MTECERLIEEGKLNPDFLKEEVRCDYVVTNKYKKIWAILIDLVQVIDKICYDNGLRYYSIGGTTMGVIRHGGFIPWDDDIDIAMRRSDFEKLKLIAPKVLEEPYFLQTPISDPKFYNKDFIRIRNSATTCISPYDSRIKCNNGIFVDIFPLDKYEDNKECNQFIKKETLKTTAAWNTYHYKYVKEKKIVRTAIKLLTPIILHGTVHQYYENHEKRCIEIDRKHYAQLGWQYAWLQYGKNTLRQTFPSEWWEPVEYMDFEYIKLPVPVHYDEMLKHQFGDYMKFPPIEERGKYHELEFEPDIDYKTYCREKYNINY